MSNKQKTAAPAADKADANASKEGASFVQCIDMVKGFVQSLTGKKLEESISLLHLAAIDLENIYREQLSGQRTAAMMKKIMADKQNTDAGIANQNKEAASSESPGTGAQAAAGTSLPVGQPG